MEEVKCRAFLSAVDHGSLTAAAEDLGYTQSGITRIINSLEEEIGFSLFIRSKKGVVLTENGRIMLPVFRDIVRAHNHAAQLSSDIRGAVCGVLTIGSYFSVSSMLLPPILKEFRTLHPGILIHMKEGSNREMTAWLCEKSVDCCFCAKPGTANCDWIPVFQDEIVAWLPQQHPLASADFFPVRDLEHEPFIQTSPDSDTDQDRLLAALQLNPTVSFTTKDAFTTYNMVAAGLGVSFNQRLISENWVGNVAEIPFSPPQYITLGIAVPSLRDASPVTRRLVEYAKKTMRSRFQLSPGKKEAGAP
ncbi:LysR family transcriptional regulator [Feifania hominis]|uniref:LysR family transcriptional regulator n=1 Tax=Feifania hominis TaxID=2763660 RepID=A0A926DDD5_9FIRM|nr:LysR family transcriptional regulator [Feifania hominis]MBC8536543.1 LysR family transcriptional regulator [Feifania hominis]